MEPGPPRGSDGDVDMADSQSDAEYVDGDEVPTITLLLVQESRLSGVRRISLHVAAQSLTACQMYLQNSTQ